MTIDLSNPQDVVAEVFDPDESVRKDFQNAVAADAVAFAEAFAPAYKIFSGFQKECEGGVQRALVGAFMHGVLDDCLTSVKLLLSGKLGASGNLARQAVEGICMALLTASPQTLRFKDQECDYWKLVVDEDERAEGNRAPYQVVANEARLGLSTGAAAQLKQNIDSHHAHSHAGRLAIALRMDLARGGKIYFGGHFDAEKLDGYHAELRQRAAICKWAVEVMLELSNMVRNLPKDASDKVTVDGHNSYRQR
ncbi:hypothetical protein [Variovorax sp. RA8]|uniref:hypothetical protein n=1 Tax=Variovorax sp. (strain JCM 16519 / RA8) TaxID=662548 RepID=UPI000A9D5A03|nr:hypothetical protein [Variovorax sp. RA8]VTU14386.1 hypothetical protein RA8CHR_00565 [Variovorax sp. RA8]